MRFKMPRFLKVDFKIKIQTKNEPTNGQTASAPRAATSGIVQRRGSM
jgi:hypothetical protein